MTRGGQGDALVRFKAAFRAAADGTGSHRAPRGPKAAQRALGEAWRGIWARQAAQTGAISRSSEGRAKARRPRPFSRGQRSVSQLRSTRMSTQYGLRKSIKSNELFDGRLEARP
jgi:hypothetical protein